MEEGESLSFGVGSEKEELLNTIRLIEKGEQIAEFDNSIDLGDDGRLLFLNSTELEIKVKSLGGHTKPTSLRTGLGEYFTLDGFGMIPGILEDTPLSDDPPGEVISTNRRNTITAWQRIPTPVRFSNFTIKSIEGGDEIENQDFTARELDKKSGKYSCSIHQGNFTFDNKVTRGYLNSYELGDNESIKFDENKEPISRELDFLDQDTRYFQICDLKETIIPVIYGTGGYKYGSGGSSKSNSEKIVVRFKPITMSIENDYGLCPLNHFYDSIQNYRKTSYSSLNVTNVTHFFKNLNRMLFDIYSCWLILYYYSLTAKFHTTGDTFSDREIFFSHQLRRDMRKVLWPNLQRHLIKKTRTQEGKRELLGYLTGLNTEQFEELISMLNEPRLDWTKRYAYFIYKDMLGNEQLYKHNGYRNKILLEYLLPKLGEMTKELYEEGLTGSWYSSYLRKESISLEMYSIIAGSGEAHDPCNFVRPYTELFREYRLYFSLHWHTKIDIPEEVKARFPLKLCLMDIEKLNSLLSVKPEVTDREVSVRNFRLLLFDYLNQRMV